MLSAIIDYMLSWCTPFWIGLYVFYACVPIWGALYAMRNLEGTPELNEKYWIFHRVDHKYWSWWKMAIMNMVLLFPIRYTIAWGTVLF